MSTTRLSILAAWLLTATPVVGQLAVTVSPVKVTGQKAVVVLGFRNNLVEQVQSARAAVFLLDNEGKMVGQATRWVVGGTKDQHGLAPRGTNVFHFVVPIDRQLNSMNLTAKVSFSRLLLEGGKAIDVTKDVQISNTAD